jgi:lysophospholipase L1-like esterase
MSVAAPPSAPFSLRTKILAGFLPFLLVLGLELILRLLGLCARPPENSLIKQYFTYQPAYKETRDPKSGAAQFSTADPTMHPLTFAKTRPAGNIRIFCLGESSVYGYGLAHNFTPQKKHVPLELTFAHILETKLRAAFPGRSIEVLNAGRSGFNSLKLRATVKELVNYAPDMIILYSGHNDYLHRDLLHQPGLALIARLARYFPEIIRWHETLSSLRTYRLLRAVILRIRPQSGPIDDGAYWQQQQELEQEIAQTFAANFDEMLKIITNRGIIPVLSTLSSNFRDKPPFESGFSRNMTYKERVEFSSHLKSGWTLAQWGELRDAINEYRFAMNIDPYYAAPHYEVARLYDRAKDFDKARIEYVMAKELDIASTEAKGIINQKIRALAEQTGLTLVDIDAIFRDRSPEAIPGNNLFADQFHPNEAGHRLMAEAYFQAIATLPLFTGGGQ